MFASVLTERVCGRAVSAGNERRSAARHPAELEREPDGDPRERVASGALLVGGGWEPEREGAHSWSCFVLQNGKNKVPYSLFVGETEITKSLQATVEELVRPCRVMMHVLAVRSRYLRVCSVC